MLCSLTSPRTNFDEQLIMMSFTCQQTFKWLPAGPLEYLFYCKLNLKTGNATRRETTTTTPCDPIQNSSGRVLMTCCLPACLFSLPACLPAYLRHVIRWGFVSISYPVKTILITVAGIQLQGHNNTSAEPMPPQGFADATRQPGRLWEQTETETDIPGRQLIVNGGRVRLADWLTNASLKSFQRNGFCLAASLSLQRGRESKRAVASMALSNWLHLKGLLSKSQQRTGSTAATTTREWNGTPL